MVEKNLPDHNAVLHHWAIKKKKMMARRGPKGGTDKKKDAVCTERGDRLEPDIQKVKKETTRKGGGRT